MTYKTCAGDTFDLIAFKKLGSCRYTELLINANRQHVATVIFRAGIELNIPNVENERRTVRPPWFTETSL